MHLGIVAAWHTTKFTPVLQNDQNIHTCANQTLTFSVNRLGIIVSQSTRHQGVCTCAKQIITWLSKDWKQLFHFVVFDCSRPITTYDIGQLLSYAKPWQLFVCLFTAFLYPLSHKICRSSWYFTSLMEDISTKGELLFRHLFLMTLLQKLGQRPSQARFTVCMWPSHLVFRHEFVRIFQEFLQSCFPN